MTALHRGVPAAAWTISARLIAKVCDFLALMLLARLLTPADFGLIAMAMTVVWIVEAVFDLPITAPLMRGDEPSESMFDTAFTLGLLRGVMVAGLLWALAWPLALYFRQPALAPVIAVLALAPVARGLVSPRMVRFMRQMDFKREFALEVTGKLAAMTVAAVMAATTGSYWALVAGTVMAPAVMLVLSYAFAPGRLRLDLQHWPMFSQVVGWGMLNQMLAASAWQGDRLLLGRVVEPGPLGQYSMASNLAALPTQALVLPAMRPLSAALMRAAAPADQARIYAMGSGLLMLLAGPALLSMVLFAPLYVRALLGPQWALAVPFLQALAAVYLIELATAPFPSLAIAAGRLQVYTIRLVVDVCIKLGVIAALVSSQGIWAAVLAYLLAAAVSCLYSGLAVRWLCACSLTAQLSAVWRPMASMALVALVVGWSEPLPDSVSQTGWALLALPVVVGFVHAAVWSLSALLWRLEGSPAAAERFALDAVVKVWSSVGNSLRWRPVGR